MSAPATVSEIALLGGSFNPPHVAHVMAAQWVLDTQPVDAVWLVPSVKHPFGKALAPFEDRMEMCRRAVENLRRAEVSGVEAELAADPLAGYTVRTLERLHEKHPGLRFALVVGSDVLAETQKWFRFDRVTQLARLILVGREGHPHPQAGPPALPRVSSTEIREALKAGRDVSRLVPRRVLDYVSEKGLYR